MGKFYLGLDIGTNSVGIAATDENYKLLRAKGQDLIAVRLFKEAQSAQERRTKRSARRRLARRKQRVDFLQDIFAPHMEDKNFFLRLNNSAYHLDDKANSIQSKYSLFADENYNDKDFYKQYPTIYHLRKELALGIDSADLRHYYLAIHHIVKYRGHFLYEGESLVQALNICSLFEVLNNVWAETYEEDSLYFAIDRAESFKELALDSRKRLNDKKKAAALLFDAKDAKSKDAISLMLGGSAKPSILFGEEYKEKKSISFAKMTDEEFESMQEDYFDNFIILQKMREIYKYIVFEKVLDGCSSISNAMVSIYQTHEKNLKEFKNFIKVNYGIDFYKSIFKSTKEQFNYVNYIGYTKPQKKKINVKKCKSEDFYKWLKKKMEAEKPQSVNEVEYEKWNSLIDENNLFPKIINADNGIFPYQINLAELEQILSNLARKYPDFNIADSDGYTPCEKIRKIFLFKIPYYVGPLNNHSKNSWVVRKQGKITPWNFNEMVNKAETNKCFIRRMTNKCSYYAGKDVLPACSIIYQKFNVLNQLNKIKINQVPISVELKQEIFNELFLTYPHVTDKKIKDYLITKGVISKSEEKEVNISGKDGDLKATMSSYITLKKVLGDIVDSNPTLCEDIILWHTLNTDKRNVESLILEKYGKEPVVCEKIKQLKGITSFKEFGRLSKEFLTELAGGVDDITGEVYTILGELYNTNQNLNEILFNEKYNFIKELEIQNGEKSETIRKEDLEDLYVSPQVRRGIWQALTMVDEYVNAIGRAPDKIFIEVAREDGEKVRTISRKNQIADIYKQVKEINELVDELNKKTDSDLRSERLYLYFLQRGRCAYTGKRINLDELVSDMYDVDHVLPRSITKDDSIDNKVLVLRTKNKEKLDTYPLAEGFTNQQGFWKELKEAGLMSAKKYDLLTRTKPLDENDFNEFINRQLVVTNQTNKAVAELLNRKFTGSGTKIVYSKASNVNSFKNEFKIIKCRETNDFHHGRDAYLNIVVGNVYDTKFSSAKSYFYQKDNVWKEYNLKYLFHKDIFGAWDKENSLPLVLKTLSRTGISVTQYSYIEKGKFYDETVYSKDETGLDAPRKENSPLSNVKKYGGYSSLKTAYFAIVNSKDKKGNKIKTIESIPVLLDYTISKNPEKLKDFLINKRGLIEPEIILPKLKLKSLIKVNGTPAYIAGVTGPQILLHNAVEWRTSPDIDEYINGAIKIVEWDRNKKLSENEVDNEFIIKTNRFNERKLCINKENNKKLYNVIIEQLSKPIYQGLTGAKTVRTVLEEHINDFDSLTTLNQAKVILQCAKWLKCNAENCDLTLIKGVSTCGKICIGKNVTNLNIEVINSSPCGLRKKVVKI